MSSITILKKGSGFVKRGDSFIIYDKAKISDCCCPTINCVDESDLPDSITINVEGNYATNKLIKGSFTLLRRPAEGTVIPYMTSSSKIISGILVETAILRMDKSGDCSFTMTFQDGCTLETNFSFVPSCQEEGKFLDASSKYVDGATIYVDGIDSGVADVSESLDSCWKPYTNPDYEESESGVSTGSLLARDSILVKVYGDDNCDEQFVDEIVSLSKKEVNNQRIVFEGTNVQLGRREFDKITVKSDMDDGGPNKITIEAVCSEANCTGTGSVVIPDARCSAGYWIDPDSIEFGIDINCDDCDKKNLKSKKTEYFGSGGSGGSTDIWPEGTRSKTEKKKRTKNRIQKTEIPPRCVPAEEMPSNFSLPVRFVMHSDKCDNIDVTKTFVFGNRSLSGTNYVYSGTCPEDPNFGVVKGTFEKSGKTTFELDLDNGYQYGTEDICVKGVLGDPSVLVKELVYRYDGLWERTIEQRIACPDKYSNPETLTRYYSGVKDGRKTQLTFELSCIDDECKKACVRYDRVSTPRKFTFTINRGDCEPLTLTKLLERDRCDDSGVSYTLYENGDIYNVEYNQSGSAMVNVSLNNSTCYAQGSFSFEPCEESGYYPKDLQTEFDLVSLGACCDCELFTPSELPQTHDFTFNITDNCEQSGNVTATLNKDTSGSSPVYKGEMTYQSKTFQIAVAYGTIDAAQTYTYSVGFENASDVQIVRPSGAQDLVSCANYDSGKFPSPSKIPEIEMELEYESCAGDCLESGDEAPSQITMDVIFSIKNYSGGYCYGPETEKITLTKDSSVTSSISYKYKSDGFDSGSVGWDVNVGFVRGYGVVTQGDRRIVENGEKHAFTASASYAYANVAVSNEVCSNCDSNRKFRNPAWYDGATVTVDGPTIDSCPEAEATINMPSQIQVESGDTGSIDLQISWENAPDDDKKSIDISYMVV